MSFRSRRFLISSVAFRMPVVSVACVAVLAQSAFAQQAPQSTLRNVDAVAAEVSGNVKRAAVGVDAKDKNGWIEVKENDTLPAGTQIKTAFRSFVTLRFGDDTVIRIRAMTLASIDEFKQSETAQSVRLSLGYGAIRGGTIERELRSELVVDSTVATLAKRGTEGINFEVIPSVGYFSGSLSRSGLLSLLHKATNRQKEVAAGESVNPDNIKDLASDVQLKNFKFKFFADELETDTESSFASKNTTGSSVTQPGSGTGSSGNTGQNDPNFVGDLIERGEVIIDPPVTGAVERAEGDFGVPDTFGALLSDILPFPRVQRDLGRDATRRGLTAHRSASHARRAANVVRKGR